MLEKLDFGHHKRTGGGSHSGFGNGYGEGQATNHLFTNFPMHIKGNGFGDPDAHRYSAYAFKIRRTYPLTDTDLLIRLAAKQLVKPTGD